ncbi:porphobilinogen deaminase [Planctomycetales bacterium]|nr:porphobilinogen deaminase [Planctomycetales bacterium]GHT07572.1 porphobilinogen deaminase [Planctomycetales bacterium]
MKRTVRFGCRESALAVAQTRSVMADVAAAHPELDLRLLTMKTRGDLAPDAPLECGGKGFFTDALERALTGGEIDVGVHSLKDMAIADNPELPIVGMTKRADPRDALILPPHGDAGGGEKLVDFAAVGEKKLTAEMPIGCGSKRRAIQLQALADRLAPRDRLASGLKIAPIRGNVPTRLAKLDRGEYGAIILAAAGLQRLNLQRAGYYFSAREMVPAAGQGILAMQGRRGENYHFLDAARSAVTEEVAAIERRIIRALGGGCGLPTGALAQICGNEINIVAMFAAADNPRSIVRDEISGDRRRGAELADTLARRLASNGAVAITKP